jgi:hypothetical protein
MLYEIEIARSFIRRPGEDWVSDDFLGFVIPDEAESALSRVIKPYGHESGVWFLEEIGYGRPPAAWAYVALPSEIDAADEIRRARDGFEEEIRFSPYTRPPDPLPSGFKPSVGIVLFYSNLNLGVMAKRSSLIAEIQNHLQGSDQRKSWLLILPEIPQNLL